MLGIFQPHKRKYDELSDSTDNVVKIVMDLYFQYTVESYEDDKMLTEVTELVFTSENNMFETKEECSKFVKDVFSVLRDA
jgi:hypothetical protein